MSELLTKMTVTVMNETAEGIRTLAKESRLSEGEVIDRLAIKVSPKDREIAVELALEELVITFAQLSEKDRVNAMVELASTLLSAFPPDAWDILLDKAQQFRSEAIRKFKDVPPEELEKPDELVEELLQKRMHHKIEPKKKT